MTCDRRSIYLGGCLERTATMDPYSQATAADSALGRTAAVDPYPQATPAHPKLERATLADTSAMKPQVEDQVEGPRETAVGGSRENDLPTGAADSVETPLFTPWTLPVDATSTGVDSRVSQMAMMEQMAWETDADEFAHSQVCRDYRAVSIVFLDGGRQGHAR